jgi:alpha-galactosidase
MFHAAMLGSMGIQTNLLQWDEAETQTATEMIRLYREIRPVIQEGDLYRLSSLRSSHFHAVEYVSQNADQAIVFVFMRTHPEMQAPVTNILRWGSPRFIYSLRPRGLIPDRLYSVGSRQHPLSGEALMQVGFPVEMEGDDDSQLICIRAVD